MTILGDETILGIFTVPILQPFCFSVPARQYSVSLLFYIVILLLFHLSCSPFCYSTDKYRTYSGFPWPNICRIEFMWRRMLLNVVFAGLAMYSRGNIFLAVQIISSRCPVGSFEPGFNPC
jgi:hypothetical protein